MPNRRRLDADNVGPRAWPARVQHVQRPSAAPEEFAQIDGSSSEIRTLKRHMRCVAADADVTVLVLGESGTGKERVASAIHRASPRSNGPFVVVDCASLATTLAEDGLFGHMRGAFTGAVDSRPGPFELADGGTVLLDEVGDLAPDLQMKLLRALQARTVQRLGARHETSFDVRIIASTHVDLATAMERGRFREDLYYRLKVYQIEVPPLRRRGRSDIEALTLAILTRLSDRRRRPVPGVDAEVVERLVLHSWPGNVRELENTFEHMLVAAGREPVLTLRHLPEDFGLCTRSPASAAHRRRVLPSAADVRAALARNTFSCGRTAADLGVSRHQLYRLLKRYAVRDPKEGE